MANRTVIAAAIEARVKAVTAGYGSWRIGLTHDLVQRKQEWENAKESCGCWTSWTADSLPDAQAVESHFINKGMKGGTGGNLSANKTVYVYIF